MTSRGEWIWRLVLLVVCTGLGAWIGYNEGGWPGVFSWGGVIFLVTAFCVFFPGVAEVLFAVLSLLSLFSC